MSKVRKILIVDEDSDEFERLLSPSVLGVELVAGRTAREVLTSSLDNADAADAWMGNPAFAAELLAANVTPPAWFQSTWAGVEPLFRGGRSPSFRVTRAIGIFGRPIAEFVLTYILAHRQAAFARFSAQQERIWDTRRPRRIAGGKALIVGSGDIGTALALTLKKLDLSVAGVARVARELEPFSTIGTLSDLPEMVKDSDYVINLLPDTPYTRDVFDASLLSRFKRGALFINVGRGTAVVESDLIDAVQSGQLSGAVLDVCRDEPPGSEHGFWQTPGIILTGHIAGPSSVPDMFELFTQNLERYRNGQGMIGELVGQSGY